MLSVPQLRLGTANDMLMSNCRISDFRQAVEGIIYYKILNVSYKMQNLQNYILIDDTFMVLIQGGVSAYGSPYSEIIKYESDKT